MSKEDSLGDRMKIYENCFRISIPKRSCVIIRIDGRAFHTYTRNFNRPFDQMLTDAMTTSAAFVAADMQGFQIAYHQSDEVSFLLHDYATIHTDAWFDNNLQKMTTIAASVMTANFDRYIRGRKVEAACEVMRKGAGMEDQAWKDALAQIETNPAYFDARAFLLPRDEVANYFLWRARDWERNSLQMYARSHFSAKELHGKGRTAMHEMLHSIGKNWTTDLTDQQRNGTFFQRSSGETDGGRFFKHHYNIKPTYESVSLFVNDFVHLEADEPDEPEDEPTPSSGVYEDVT